MRENLWPFTPTHKVWLMTNYKPLIRGTDPGIWNKVRLVPFSTTIPPAEQDKKLSAKLREEFPGILAWLVRGCLAWQETGLAAPPEINRATDDYRDEMDTLGGFLEERCVTDNPEAKVPHGALYDAYKSWAIESNERPATSRELAKLLRERGYQITPGTKGTKTWRGLGLLLLL
jgi:putative DNA primase/helicase